MAASRHRTLLILAIIGAASFSACNPLSKLLYHGDGTLSDRSEFNRPRFIIAFNKIPIFEVGTYQFHFRGVPHEQMTLILHINENSPLHEGDLKSLQTAIEAALVDSHGNDICKSSRRPGLNDQDSVWVLSGGVEGDWEFWHWQCHNFEAHPRDSYELTIRVVRVDIRGERIFVTPTLEGGGTEFP
jgi:hypothetical protein